MRAKPGKIITWGAMRAHLRLSCSMEPHSAVGGRTPRPKKLNEATVMMVAATVVILAPIALAIAKQLEISPDPFLIAVAVGASCDFVTPFGHHNNTLIMGPGGYRFTDFARMGAPLELPPAERAELDEVASQVSDLRSSSGDRLKHVGELAGTINDSLRRLTEAVAQQQALNAPAPAPAAAADADAAAAAEVTPAPAAQQVQLADNGTSGALAAVAVGLLAVAGGALLMFRRRA